MYSHGRISTDEFAQTNFYRRARNLKLAKTTICLDSTSVTPPGPLLSSKWATVRCVHKQDTSSTSFFFGFSWRHGQPTSKFQNALSGGMDYPQQATVLLLAFSNFRKNGATCCCYEQPTQSSTKPFIVHIRITCTWSSKLGHVILGLAASIFSPMRVTPADLHQVSAAWKNAFLLLTVAATQNSTLSFFPHCFESSPIFFDYRDTLQDS